jgi:hypothetical protein
LVILSPVQDEVGDRIPDGTGIGKLPGLQAPAHGRRRGISPQQFRSMTMGLFGNLFGGATARKPPAATNPLLTQIVDTLGESITSAAGWEKQLTPAVEIASAYFDRQIAAIPGPVTLSLQAHGDDPLVTAVFPSPDDIRIAMGRSVEVREFLPRLSRAGHVHLHALLGMRHRPGAGSGPESTVIADHTLKCLAPSEKEARLDLQKVAFGRLLKNFVEHLDKLKLKGKLLKVEWNIFNDASAAAGKNGNEFVYADQELTPDNILRGLAAWLNDPSKHLRVCVGEAKIATKGGDGSIVTSYDLPMLHSTDRRQWIVCLVKFSTHEGAEALEKETRTHRYILI